MELNHSPLAFPVLKQNQTIYQAEKNSIIHLLILLSMCITKYYIIILFLVSRDTLWKNIEQHVVTIFKGLLLNSSSCIVFDLPM